MNAGAVRSAAARIAGRVHRTPVLTSATLDGRTGTRVTVKNEAVQKTGSWPPLVVMADTVALR